MLDALPVTQWTASKHRMEGYPACKKVGSSCPRRETGVVSSMVTVEINHVNKTRV